MPALSLQFTPFQLAVNIAIKDQEIAQDAKAVHYETMTDELNSVRDAEASTDFSPRADLTKQMDGSLCTSWMLHLILTVCLVESGNCHYGILKAPTTKSGPLRVLSCYKLATSPPHSRVA